MIVGSEAQEEPATRSATTLTTRTLLPSEPGFWGLLIDRTLTPELRVCRPGRKPIFRPKSEKKKARTWIWEKLNRGVSKPGASPLFSGNVQIVSRTLSGLFLVGALNRPRKRKRTNRENPQTIPEQIGKILERRKKDKKGQRASPRIDERQITHLICARLKYDLYDFLGGVLGPFIQEEEQEAGRKHP